VAFTNLLMLASDIPFVTPATAAYSYKEQEERLMTQCFPLCAPRMHRLKHSTTSSRHLKALTTSNQLMTAEWCFTALYNWNSKTI